MAGSSSDLMTRAERLRPKPDSDISVHTLESPPRFLGRLECISRSGIRFNAATPSPLHTGSTLPAIALRVETRDYPCGSAVVSRVGASSAEHVDGGEGFAALAFENDQTQLVEALRFALRPQQYVTGELEADTTDRYAGLDGDASEHTIDMFYNHRSRDLFAKCESFRPWIQDMQRKELYQRMYRVTLTSGLDNRVTIFDPLRRCERSMICFDSNSYLGLHHHPRVVERVEQVLRRVGYGTGSAQLLSGTNQYLRALEEELSDFLGRDDTVIFPTGYAANVGTVHALVRAHDVIFRDRFSHASLHDGCKTSAARVNQVFAHNDMAHLGKLLTTIDAAGCDGKLIVTDGVFSMHGRIAPLPELVRLAKQHDARLMVDDAHGLGVLGATGRGIEELWGMPGSVDVLMGTLSKALGAVGGFVSGSHDLVNYLRFYASTGMFTTTLPAATCAGVHEALRVVRSEPEHRERLWANIRTFVPALRDAGFLVPDPDSPIVTVFLGMHPLMLEFSRGLFEAGIKAGNVMYPAVPRGDSILRFTVNARHTAEDLGQAVDVLTELGKRWGILHKSAEEVREIGARLRTARPSAPAPVPELAQPSV